MVKNLTLRHRPELITERLLLRRPYDGDVDAIVSIVGDWEVVRRLARVPHPYTAADARFFLDQVVPAEWVWAITLQGSDELIGAIGLTPEEGEHTAELGYWLSPPHWGRGIATEAASPILSFGFETLELPYLTSGYFEDNTASGRVLEKLGFVVCGHVLRPCLAMRENLPLMRMQMMQPIWRRLRALADDVFEPGCGTGGAPHMGRGRPKCGRSGCARRCPTSAVRHADEAAALRQFYLPYKPG